MRYLNTRLYSSVIAGVIAFLMVFCSEAKAENSSKIVKLSMNKTVWNTLVNKNINPFRSNTATWDKAGKNQIKPEEFLKMKEGTIFYVSVGSPLTNTTSTVNPNNSDPVSQPTGNNAKIDSTLNEKVKKLDQALNEEKAKNTQLEAQLKKLTEDNKANDPSKLNEELSKKQDEVNLLNKKINQLEANNTQNGNNSVEQINKLSQEHQQELLKKQTEIDALKAKNSELETANQQKLSALEAENAKLKSGINLSSIWATNWFLTLLVPFIIFMMGFLFCYLITQNKSKPVQNNLPAAVKPQPIPTASNTQTAPNENWLKRLTSKEAISKLKAEGIDGYMAHIRGFQEYIP